MDVKAKKVTENPAILHSDSDDFVLGIVCKAAGTDAVDTTDWGGSGDEDLFIRYMISIMYPTPACKISLMVRLTIIKSM